MHNIRPAFARPIFVGPQYEGVSDTQGIKASVLLCVDSRFYTNLLDQDSLRFWGICEKRRRRDGFQGKAQGAVCAVNRHSWLLRRDLKGVTSVSHRLHAQKAPPTLAERLARITWRICRSLSNAFLASIKFEHHGIQFSVCLHQEINLHRLRQWFQTGLRELHETGAARGLTKCKMAKPGNHSRSTQLMNWSAEVKFTAAWQSRCMNASGSWQAYPILRLKGVTCISKRRFHML